MIFAAGLGTRLRPLTDTMPKALVPVSGRPILGYQLERLAAAGVKEVVVNVHHFAEQVIRYLEEHDFGLRVRVSDERDELLDTGGGLARARQWLDGDAPVLVHNVDILSNVDLHRWAGAHPDGTTLLVSERQTQRYLLFDEENRLVGWTNVATGQVRSPYSKLDVARCRRYAFSGIQLFSPRLFSLMEGWPRRFPSSTFIFPSVVKCLFTAVRSPDCDCLTSGNLPLWPQRKTSSHRPATAPVPESCRRWHQVSANKRIFAV